MNFRMILFSAVFLLALVGISAAEIVVNMSFDTLDYDTDGLTSDGQIAVDQSGNGYHGFYGGGSDAAIIETPFGLGIDTSTNNVFIIGRDGREYSGHGDPSVPDPVTSTTPFFQLESSKNYTFEAMLKWDTSSSDTRHGIMGATNYSSQFWMRENNGYLQWALGNEGGLNANHFASDVDISALEADGQWHHLALVLDRTASEIRVYADYQLIYTDTNANIGTLGTVLTGTDDFRFGGYNTTGNDLFDGGQGGYVISDEALEPGSFVMFPGDIASTPMPSNGQQDVELDANLKWNNPTDYTASKFVLNFRAEDPNWLEVGTTTIDPVVDLNIDGDPGTTEAAVPVILYNLQDYYWRVDSYEPNDLPGGVDILHTGDTWNFTTIAPTPLITTQPVGDVDSSVELTVEASNPEVYQWYRVADPNVLVRTTGTLGTAGPDSDTYKATDEGYYYCVVSNTVGSVVSDTVLVMNPRMIAHWTLDTDATDSSGNGYHGMNSGADPNTGIINGAFEFSPADLEIDPNDPDDHIDLTAHVNDLGMLEQGTITAWLKTSAAYTVNAGVVISAYDSTVGSTEGRFFIELGGNIVWDVRDQGGSSNGEDGRISGPAVNDGQWHMIAITVGDEQNATMYVDGLAVETGVEPFWGQISVLNGMAIGRNMDDETAPQGQWKFDGLLDDIRIYTNPLTAYDIADMFTPVGGPICTNDPSIPLTFDFNDDCIVDLTDFAPFAADWLNCSLYPDCTTVIP